MHEYSKNILTKVTLQKALESPMGFHALSLMYRLNGDYRNELSVVENAMKLFPTYEYFHDRNIWHSQSAWKKSAPRIIKNNVTPYEAKDLIFITGSDAEYYDLLIGMIESVKATKNYSHVPIGVLDCGLTDEQKHFISTHYDNVVIKDPGWDIELEGIYLNQKINPLKNGHKGMVARPYIDKHFPGYRFYLWIDADAWISDENVIARYIELAKQEGLSTTKALCDKYKSHISATVKPRPLWEEYHNELLNNDALCLINGGFCIDASRPIFDKWREVFETSIKNHCFHFYTDYVTFNYLVYKLGVKNFLPFEDHFYFTGNPSSGNPVLKDDSNKIYCPLSEKPIGILHLTQIKNKGFDLMQFPTQQITGPFTPEKLQEHLMISQLSWVKPYEVQFPNQVFTSYAFRTYKSENIDYLINEIGEKVQCLN